MKFFRPKSGIPPFLVVGVVALSVAGVHCNLRQRYNENDHILTFFKSPPENLGSSNIPVCTAAGERSGVVKPSLNLTAAVDQPLKFQCGNSQTLAPADKKKEKTTFASFYAYTEETGCDTAKIKSLANEQIGAKLETDEAALNPLARGKGVTSEQHSRTPQDVQPEPEPAKTPVYTFTYTIEPTEAKHLCYLCNSTETNGVGHLKSPPLDDNKIAPCAVRITVPKKAEKPPVVTTAAPDFTSDSRAMTTSLATATAGLLAVILAM